jgi:hypothetical protein
MLQNQCVNSHTKLLGCFVNFNKNRIHWAQDQQKELKVRYFAWEAICLTLLLWLTSNNHCLTGELFFFVPFLKYEVRITYDLHGLVNYIWHFICLSHYNIQIVCKRKPTCSHQPNESETGLPESASLARLVPSQVELSLFNISCSSTWNNILGSVNFIVLLF